MRKHIVGLVIFSFVVFAAAFVYGIFRQVEIDSVAVTPSFPTYDKLDREVNQSENISSNVAQAVYSVKTKKLTWQGELPNEKGATHFDLWAADGKGFDYLGAMRVETARGDAFAADDLNRSLSSIAPPVNLYLIAEDDEHFKLNDGASTLRFNARNAVPVTIDYGE